MGRATSFLDRQLGVIVLWAPVVIYMAAIFWMSSRSDPIPGLRLVSGTDKVAHALAYGLLAYLFTRALHQTWPSRGAITMAALGAAIASLYGALDEFHQTFVPGRHGSIWDVVADTVGAILGASIYLAFFKMSSRKLATGHGRKTGRSSMSSV